jgi:CBS domain-containing protein
MKVRDILQAKGTRVHTISSHATLADVVEQLVANNCGSLVVCDNNQMVGIITERDILRATLAGQPALAMVKVAERMTRRVVTGHPDDEVSSVMGLLTERRIRHLPITDDEGLLGIVSIGDVVKAQHDDLSLENHFLKNYLLSN